MDNLIVKKVWSDNDFFQIEFMFKTQMIECRTITYSIDKEIKQLSDEFIEFSLNPTNKVYWEIGESGSDYNPKICINSSFIDKKGHVLLDIFCDVLSPYEFTNYYCKFPFMTELGLIQEFGKNILKLLDSDVNNEISLL